MKYDGILKEGLLRLTGFKSTCRSVPYVIPWLLTSADCILSCFESNARAESEENGHGVSEDATSFLSRHRTSWN